MPITHVYELILALVLGIAGGSFSSTRQFSSKVAAIEIALARDYVSRSELSQVLQRFEDHMVRIEDKLDNLREKDYYADRSKRDREAV